MYNMAQEIWEAFVVFVVAMLLGVLLFKALMLPEDTSVFEIKENAIDMPL